MSRCRASVCDVVLLTTCVVDLRVLATVCDALHRLWSLERFFRGFQAKGYRCAHYSCASALSHLEVVSIDR